jgi:hypothetical protein
MMISVKDFIERFRTPTTPEPVVYDDATLLDANLRLAKAVSLGQHLSMRLADWGQLGDGTPEFHRQMGRYLFKRYPDITLKEALRSIIQEVEDEPILAELV